MVENLLHSDVLLPRSYSAHQKVPKILPPSSQYGPRATNAARELVPEGMSVTWGNAHLRVDPGIWTTGISRETRGSGLQRMNLASSNFSENYDSRVLMSKEGGEKPQCGTYTELLTKFGKWNPKQAFIWKSKDMKDFFHLVTWSNSHWLYVFIDCHFTPNL